jgi:hypothetical protein
MKTPENSEETGIVDALARLRESVEVPPIDPARESALLAAFDAHRARPRRSLFPVWTAAAALILVTVSLNWLVVRKTPSANVVNVVNADPAIDLAGFVAWPGASAWPPFESGSLIRVELPVSMLPTLGLSAPSSATGLVPADIVVGQDGLARAVRLVQQQ